MRVFYIFLLVSLFQVSSVCFSDQPAVMVTGYTTAPDVMIPGEIGSITITLTNTAQQATLTSSSSAPGDTNMQETRSLTVPVNAFIESVTMKTKDFQILSGWYEDLGEIGPGQSVPLTFLVRAPVSEGVYFPEVWIRIRDSASVKYPVPVNVNSAYALSRQPSLTVAREVPDHVIPGEGFSVVLDLLNDGPAKAHDITLQAEIPNRSVSSAGPERMHIGEIAPGDHETINLSFITDKDIPIGIQQIPVRISYLNTDGSRIDQVSRIGVLIQGAGDIGIAKVLTEPDIISSGDIVTLVIRVENTGTDDAKSVRVTTDIPYEGMKDAFVGTIEPHNDAPAVFTLKVTSPGEISYNVTISYQDDYGNHDVSFPMSIAAYDGNGSWVIGLVILVFIMGAGLYLLVRRVYSS